MFECGGWTKAGKSSPKASYWNTWLWLGLSQQNGVINLGPSGTNKETISTNWKIYEKRVVNFILTFNQYGEIELRENQLLRG